ncbi:MAG: TIGR03009 domain-containing protein [Pirellulaceae bacterium]
MTRSLYKLAGFVVFVSLLVPAAVGQQPQQTNPQQGTTPGQTGQALTPATGAQDSGQALQGGQPQAVAPVQLAPQMPPGFPLQPEMQTYIEQLLQHWEDYSSKVQRYKCNFTRWQYDQEVCNYRNPANNRLMAAMISMGHIRFQDPDQGMYEVVEKWQFDKPAVNPEDNPFVRPALTNPEFPEAEKWICDGIKIYEFDYLTKRLYELTLPPESQGEGLKNSPLPFVFGAKADDLQERYWIRDVTPQELHGQQYWLEAWPKRATDAQAYSKLEIILTRNPFLPVAVHMYAPNFDIKLNPSKMVFQFEERQINGKLDGLANFAGFFINPRTPAGWERVPKQLVQDPRDRQVPQVGLQPAPEGQPSVDR